jgi:hypothetical protein
MIAALQRVMRELVKEVLESTPGPFFSPWNRFSPGLLGGVTHDPEKRSDESDFHSGGLVFPFINVLSSRDYPPGPLGESDPICEMDLEGLLRNREQSFGCCSVLVGLLQRRDSLALAVEVA